MMATRPEIPIVLGCLLAALLITSSAVAHEDLEDRLALLTLQIEERPHEAHLYHVRGELFRLDGQWAAAWQDYGHAERLSPGSGDVDVSRARMLLKLGAPDRALERIERAASRDADPGPCLLVRSEALAQLGRSLDAAQAAHRAWDHLDELRPAHVLAAVDHKRDGGQTHAAEALSWLADGMQRIGSSVALQLRAVDLELELGRFDDAVRRLDLLVETAPRPDSWLVRRAEAWTLAGRPRAARHDFALALAHVAALPRHVRELPMTRELVLRARAGLARLSGQDAFADRPDASAR